MLVADFVESRFSTLHDSYLLYLNQVENESFKSFDSLLTMIDRLDVECSVLCELSRDCCSDYPDLISACFHLSEDVSDLESDLIKSHYKRFLK